MTALAPIAGPTRRPVRWQYSVDNVDLALPLGHGLTVYGAAYVALAETTGATLLTLDQRLANAPGIRCQTDLLN